MYQYGFINCNECATLIQDVNNRENNTGGREWGSGGIWNSVDYLFSCFVNLKLYF